MYDSIVVPVDLTDVSDRAIRVARRLADASRLPLELVTVVPDDRSGIADRAQLEWRAECVGATAAVLIGDDAVEALTEHIEARPDVLVVLGTHARGPLSELLLGSVSEALLARVERPMLLVGPHVDADGSLGEVTVGAVADRAGGTAMVPWLAAWSETFRSEPWIVQVGKPTGTPEEGRGTGMVQRFASELRARGIDAQWDVLHGRSAPDALVDFTACMHGGVIAVASERWTSGHRHAWASTARSLVHRSPFPVLVVPLQRVPVPA